MHAGTFRPLAWLLLALCSATAHAQTIATGASHGLALTADGSVLAWGDNRLAQLGSGKTLYVPTAREIALPAKAVAVQASSTSALVLDDQGNVWSWGTNRRGELGDGTHTDRPTPRIVLRNAAKITINGGSSSPSFVIDKDGQPWWWGPMYAGGEVLVPTRAAQVPARLVTVGQYGPTTAGLDDKGVIWAWGEYVPCAASTGPSGPVAMAGLPPIERFYIQQSAVWPPEGGRTLFSRAEAVDTSGRAWKWGGEAGFGPGPGPTFGIGMPWYLNTLCPPVRSPQDDPRAPYTPVAHSELVRAGTAIARFITSDSAQAQASNTYTTLGITADGELWQWRQEYQAPPGMTLRHEASNVVDASRYSTREREGALGLIYVTRDGKVYAKGTNYNLHLGIAPAEADGADAVSSPLKVQLPSAAVSVHANGTGSYALLKDGILLAWGAGAGQLDRFSDIGWYSVPERPSQVALPFAIARIAVAHSRWLALDTGGGVWSSDEWGSGPQASGVLRPTMVSRVNGLPAARAISLGGTAAGGSLASILGVDGSVWTMGASAGVFPPPPAPRPGLDELFSQMRVPRKVLGLPSSIVQVASVGRSSYALDASGGVWFWGQHAYGLGGRSAAQVGIDLVVNEPYVLPLPQKAVSIHTNANDEGFCAVLADGSAQCYGRMFNEHAGRDFRLHAPIQELSIGVAEMGQGLIADEREGSVHFRLADGTVWAWGRGRHGQLGNGTFANAAEPTPVNNEAGTGDLDLAPATPNVPTASRPPFRVKTRLAGNLRTLSFDADVFGSAGLGAGNVYAFATADLRTWMQLDGQGQWGPLRSTVPAAASNVPLGSEAQSAPLAILPQFAGTGLASVRIFVGQGRDAQEMLSTRRFREVLELAPED